MRVIRAAMIVLAGGLSASAGLMAAPAAQAEPVLAPVVVELYTSQGCSSCPPADELLSRLAERPEVLPLAMHVDYWDYIGWKDEFASPAHTKRQKGYAHVANRRMIYTPQMVIMGQEDVVGADVMAVTDLLAKYHREPRPVAVQVFPDGNRARLTATPVLDLGDGVTHYVQLVRYTPFQTVSIGRGELAGHTLDYANVVQQIEIIHEWDGTGELDLSVPLDKVAKTALLIQAGAYGPIVGAARLD